MKSGLPLFILLIFLSINSFAQADVDRLKEIVSTLYHAETDSSYHISTDQYIEYLDSAVGILEECEFNAQTHYSYGKFLTQVIYNHNNEIITDVALRNSNVYNIIRFIFEYNYPDCIVTRCCRNDIIADYIIDKISKVASPQCQEYTSYLYFSAVRHKFRGDYLNYVRLLEKIIAIVDTNKSNIAMLADLAEVYYLLGQYDKVVDIFNPLDFAKHLDNPQSLAKAVRYLSLSYGEMNCRVDALRIGQMYLDLVTGDNEILFDEEERAVANAIVLTYDKDLDIHKNSDALLRKYLRGLGESGITFEENLLINYWSPIEHNLYPGSMMSYLLGMGNDSNIVTGDRLYAASRYAFISPLMTYINMNISENFAQIPSFVISCFSNLGNLDKASEICILNIMSGKEEEREEYFRCLLDVVSEYVKRGDVKYANLLTSPDRPYMCLIESMDEPSKLEAYSNLALIDLESGKVDIALEKLEEAYERMQLLGILTTEREYKICSNIAMAYSNMGMHSEAKQNIGRLLSKAACDEMITPEEKSRLYTVASIIYGNCNQFLLQKNFHELAYNLQNIPLSLKIDLGFKLAEDYLLLGDSINAKSFYESSIEQMVSLKQIDLQLITNNILYNAKRIYGVEDAINFYSGFVSSAFLSTLGIQQQIDLLLLYSGCLTENHQYEESLNILNALNENYDIIDRNRDNYYKCLGNVYRSQSLFTKALECDLNRLEKCPMDTLNPDKTCIDIYNHLALDYLSLNNYDKFEEWLIKATNAKMIYVDRQFAGLNYDSRESLWSIYEEFFDGLYTLIESSQQASKLFYDLALFRKGLLLKSEQRLQETINCSNDTKLKSMYNQYRWSRNAKIAMPLANRLDYERIIFDKITQLNGMTKPLSVKWLAVKDKLHEDEVAIEFMNTSSLDKETSEFVALILKSAYKEPKIVRLQKYNALANLDMDDMYESDSIYQIIWRPIESELEGVRNIYFSADKDLHKIGIEYAPLPEGGIIGDKYNLYRLSSTRVLAENRATSKKESAVLYGGLCYDLDRDDLIAESRTGDYHPTGASRAFTAENSRYGVKYLPGTLKEVTEISQNFHATPRVITDISGTEESFKSLAGSAIDIIHLATHGFFWSEEDAQKRDYVTFLSQSGNKVRTEDKALMRSGLFFSGANIGLKGEALPDDVEDGVLTALELSNMNLGNVDMVVMSACESGLGETSGEGVFGLQRGFKLAGANTLLMSLWKVDDTATQKLMMEFYSHYLSGKSKQESLNLAQQSLRNDSQYSDPEYWAAFILLDGLN